MFGAVAGRGQNEEVERRFRGEGGLVLGEELEGIGTD